MAEKSLRASLAGFLHKALVLFFGTYLFGILTGRLEFHWVRIGGLVLFAFVAVILINLLDDSTPPLDPTFRKTARAHGFIYLHGGSVSRTALREELRMGEEDFDRFVGELVQGGTIRVDEDGLLSNSEETVRHIERQRARPATDKHWQALTIIYTEGGHQVGGRVHPSVLAQGLLMTTQEFEPFLNDLHKTGLVVADEQGMLSVHESAKDRLRSVGFNPQ